MYFRPSIGPLHLKINTGDDTVAFGWYDILFAETYFEVTGIISILMFICYLI